jgi:predicted  nucleic acid-binding Zn-ribbon protein
MTAAEHAELVVRLEQLERTGRDLSRALNEEIGANKARERALSERLRRLECQLGELSAVLDAVHLHVHRLAERAAGEQAAVPARAVSYAMPGAQEEVGP